MSPLAFDAIVLAGGRSTRLGGVDKRIAAQRLATLDGVSVHELVAPLILEHVDVPAGTTRDVDTWDDDRALGVEGEHDVT